LPGDQGDEIDPDELLALEVDILAPSALENAISEAVDATGSADDFRKSDNAAEAL